MNIYQQYATLYEKIEEAEAQIEELKEKIIEDMASKQVTEIEEDEGTFRLRKIKRWRYSDNVTALATSLTLAKRVEEKSGVAKLELERWSLSFNQ